MPKTEWNWQGHISFEEHMMLDQLDNVVSNLKDEIERIRECQKTVINNATVRAKTAKDKIKPFKV